jgi:hypothetical protein
VQSTVRESRIGTEALQLKGYPVIGVQLPALSFLFLPEPTAPKPGGTPRRAPGDPKPSRAP